MKSWEFGLLGIRGWCNRHHATNLGNLIVAEYHNDKRSVLWHSNEAYNTCYSWEISTFKQENQDEAKLHIFAWLWGFLQCPVGDGNWHIPGDVGCKFSWYYLLWALLFLTAIQSSNNKVAADSELINTIQKKHMISIHERIGCAAQCPAGDDLSHIMSHISCWWFDESLIVTSKLPWTNRKSRRVRLRSYVSFMKILYLIARNSNVSRINRSASDVGHKWAAGARWQFSLA